MTTQPTREELTAALRAAENAATRAADAFIAANQPGRGPIHDAWYAASVAQTAAFWALWKHVNPNSKTQPATE